MQIVESISHTYSSDIHTILRTLNSIENDTIACDFEGASRYTDSEKAHLQDYLDAHEHLDPEEVRQIRQFIESTGLSHPSLTYITHLSVAWSPTDSFVAVLDTEQKRRTILRWLVSTHHRQIWHNFSFDGKLIQYHTGRLPQNYEDTEVLAKTLINHVNTYKAKTGLKHLMGYKYGDWAVAKDHFNLDSIHDEDLIKYAAIDACATYALWEEINESTGERAPPIVSNPLDLLPLPEPRSSNYPDGWFYENVAKHLISDTIRIMNNGLPIDLSKVSELEIELDTILTSVQKTVDENPYIQRFLEQKYPGVAAALQSEIESKMRPPSFYLKDFDPGHMTHRSYFMLVFLEQHAEELFDTITPLDEVAPGVPKWTVRDVKPLSDRYHVLQQLIKKTISPSHPIALEAMNRFAADKSEVYNRSYLSQIANISFDTVMEQFNPGSSVQLREFFDWLEVDPIEFSKDTGEPSWGREQIEELLRGETDEDLRTLYQAFIDRSFAAIVRNNFINAFYRYTILHDDGVHRLHGSMKLGGAKTFRYTSNNPNLLNLPSTGSIYSKPIKKCLVAPEGFVVATADYNALEDRVLANLSNDEGKCSIIEKGLDGHCYNALGYYTEEVESIIGSEGSYEDKVRRFKDLSSNNPRLKELRQESKPNTFKLAYGGYPDSHRGGSITQQVFDNYHNVLYPGVKSYTENYVLQQATEFGKVHLGMGFYIRTDRPESDRRTLHNGTCQFWSILSALTINKIHKLIDENGYSNDIVVTSTIYDSIYFIVKKDYSVVKWLNDTLIPVMNTNFLINQRIPNDCSLDIGYDWSNLVELPHNCSEEVIEKLLKEI